MSTIAERARNEADEAERDDEEAAEAGEVGTPPEPEPEPTEPPEDQPVSEARFAKIEKQITAEDTRHEKRLHEIYGDLWGEREVCPLCMQEGFIVPPGPEGFDPEHRMVVLAAMGDLTPTAYKAHPKIHKCEQCDGLGFLATGSQRDGFTERACFRCDGNGYIDQDIEDAMRGVQSYDNGRSVAAPPPLAAVVNSDTWGRPAGHPHWGQNPADVGIPL